MQPILLHTTFSFPDCLIKSWKQAINDYDESVASWGYIMIFYQKSRVGFWSIGIKSNYFLIFFSLATNIFTYYILISIFPDVIMKTGPRGNWWDRCFMRMYNNIVTKINSSLLVDGDLFMFFLNFLELCNQYYCIQPSHFQIWRCNHEHSPQRTLMNL